MSSAMRWPALGFATGVLAASVFLQRFGVPAGGKAVNVVGLIGLALAGWGVLRGTLVFGAVRLGAFLALCALVLAGMAYHLLSPGRFAAAQSVQSVVQFLVLTGFATLSFREAMPEERFFRRVNAVLAIVAVAGMLQFAAQFAGIRVFSWRGFVPAAFLFEDGYNPMIPLGFANAYKANGFFLLEPSIFSQFMALALIVELLVGKRLGYILLFVTGLALSGAGTGWIVLVAFVGSAAFTLGRRGTVVAAVTLVVLAGLVGAVSVFAPDAAAAFGSRLDEVFRPSTSGHLRFITPFWLLGDVLNQEPMAALLGVGGGVSERLTMPYEYDVNTPVKIAVEYGFPALVAYIAVLAAGRKSPVQRALVAPGLVLLMFTGGYQQFAPMLFPVLLLMSVARLTPREEMAAPDQVTDQAAAASVRPVTAS